MSDGARILIVTMVAGALVGIGVGYAVFRVGPGGLGSFTSWIADFPSDAVLWAAIGGVVGASIVYVRGARS